MKRLIKIFMSAVLLVSLCSCNLAIELGDGFVDDTAAKAGIDVAEICGTYKFEKLLYLTPAVSMSSEAVSEGLKDSYYTITEDSMRIVENGKDETYENVTYSFKPLLDSDIEVVDSDTYPVPDLSRYNRRYICFINYEISGESCGLEYCLYFMDDQVWIATGGLETLTMSSIYQLKKE